jgi:DNA (cytosine-5)-methyltransferase 1
MKRLPTAIDLFCGCGGMSLGLMKAGWNVICGIDNSPDALATYYYNLCDKNSRWIGQEPKHGRIAKCTMRGHVKPTPPVSVVICDDITKWSGRRLLKACDVKQVDALFGGPPCQGFSTSNTKDRGLDNPKSRLMYQFIKLVRQIQPKVFEIENVPGMMAYKDFTYLLMETLEKAGYVVRINKMDACSYGVPQHRVRVFIQGWRKDQHKIPRYPIPTHFSPDELRGKLLRPADIIPYAFAEHGFPKEDLNDLWFNEKLWILMNKKTRVETLDRAVNRALGELVMSHIKKHRKSNNIPLKK